LYFRTMSTVESCKHICLTFKFLKCSFVDSLIKLVSNNIYDT